MYIGMQQGGRSFRVQLQRFNGRRPNPGATAADVWRNDSFGLGHGPFVTLSKTHSFAGAKKILESQEPFQVRAKARTVIVAAMHGSEGIDDLFSLLTSDRCGPFAELSRLGRNEIVEKVYRTSRSAIPCGVIAARSFNTQFGTDVTIEARLPCGREAGRKPGQNSRSRLTEQILRQVCILTFFIIHCREPPPNAGALIAPPDFHRDNPRALDLAA